MRSETCLHWSMQSGVKLGGLLLSTTAEAAIEIYLVAHRNYRGTQSADVEILKIKIRADELRHLLTDSKAMWKGKQLQVQDAMALRASVRFTIVPGGSQRSKESLTCMTHDERV